MDHSVDNRLRGNIADFPTRKCVAKEKGLFGSPCSQRTKSNTKSTNYSKESKVKCKGSTARFVGSLSLKVFKNC